MSYRISATELARRLGDVLGRVRYRGDSFVVERHGAPVARIEAVASSEPCTVAGAMAAWLAEGPDPAFADDLEAVGAADRAPADPWQS
jgi:prevent-host-death family protein